MLSHLIYFFKEVNFYDKVELIFSNKKTILYDMSDDDDCNAIDISSLESQPKN